MRRNTGATCFLHSFYVTIISAPKHSYSYSYSLTLTPMNEYELGEGGLLGLIRVRISHLPKNPETPSPDSVGIAIDCVSRPLRPEDFDRFQYIMAMDRSNKEAILNAANVWGMNTAVGQNIHMMTSYCREHQVEEVPDPYYGGAKGFERVLDLLGDACVGLLEAIESRRGP